MGGTTIGVVRRSSPRWARLLRRPCSRYKTKTAFYRLQSLQLGLPGTPVGIPAGIADGIAIGVPGGTEPTGVPTAVPIGAP